MNKKKEFDLLFEMVYKRLEGANFITYIDLEINPKLRLGLFCVMTCYHIGYTEGIHGAFRWICLKNGENGIPLTTKELKSLPFDMNEYKRLYNDFIIGADPFDMKTKKTNQIQEPSLQKFGWISPTGEFTEAPFGTHEQSAESICRKKKFDNEKKEWKRKKMEENPDIKADFFTRDFLIYVKGYALVHSPSMQGYIVTHIKPLTKKQREFLYDYFMKMGNIYMAEIYLEY